MKATIIVYAMLIVALLYKLDIMRNPIVFGLAVTIAFAIIYYKYIKYISK